MRGRLGILEYVAQAIENARLKTWSVPYYLISRTSAACPKNVFVVLFFLKSPF